MLVIVTLGWILALAATIGGLYTVMAALLSYRRRPGRRSWSEPTWTSTVPGASLIKPLHGAPVGLYEALQSFCRQDYAGDTQIVFGVQAADDPAIAVVTRLQAAHPDQAIDLVINPTLLGANRKVSNLIHCAAAARHDVLVLSDADIAVSKTYLAEVVAALTMPGVGAVTCLYVGDGRAGLWAELTAMAINYNFLPNALLGKAMGMAHPCFGSTIALSRDTLSRTGGFESVSNQLADDYEIGVRVRALGLTIVMPAMVVSHTCHETAAGELFAHELRWARTIRLIDPAGYAGSVITHPLPLALLAAVFLGFSPPALILVAVILLLRIGAKICIDAATGARAGSWWLIPARDVLSFFVFIASFAGNTVDWQGRRYRIGRDGSLVPSQGS